MEAYAGKPESTLSSTLTRRPIRAHRVTVTIDPQDFQGSDCRIAVQSNPANDAEQAKTIPLTGPATFGGLTGSSPAMTPCRDSCASAAATE